MEAYHEVPRPVDGEWTRITVGTHEETRTLVRTLGRVLERSD